MTAPTPQALKNARLAVTRGQHEGAQIELPAGRSLIGSDVGCDIVLNDEGVLPRHCVLDIGAAGVIIDIEAGARVDLNGWPVRGAQPVQSPAVLTIGAANLVLEWVQAGAPVAAQTVAAAPPPVRSSGWRPVLDYAAAWTVLAALVGAVGAIASIAPQTDQRSVAPASPAATLTAVNALGFKELRVSEKDGGLRLAGYLADEDEMTRLRQTLDRLGAPAAYHDYHVVPRLQERIERYLSEARVQVAYVGDGRFSLAGQATGERFRERLARLQSDLAGVAEVQVKQLDSPELPGALLRLPLRIVAVQLSSPAHFVAADGGQYFVGARLTDGSEVVAILPHAVVFARQGRRVKFQLSSQEVTHE
jgi:hypothetical protein